jgi:hypothetical protein
LPLLADGTENERAATFGLRLGKFEDSEGV